MHSSYEKQLETIYQILHYDSTPCKGLLFQNNPQQNYEVYTDAY